MISTFILPLRTVNRLYSLKGANRLGIITEGFFGREKAFTINLSEASFLSRRPGENAQKKLPLKFKIQNHKLKYKLDILHGQFQEPILFDYLICKKRTH